MRTLRLLPLAAVLALAAAAPASAHEVDVDTIASGLDNPRHLAVSPTGDVFVAEAGRGGDAHRRARASTAPRARRAPAPPARSRGSRQGPRPSRSASSPAWPPSRRIRRQRDRPARHLRHGAQRVRHQRRADRAVRGTPPVPLLRDPTLVDEEPVSARFGTLLKLGRGARRADRRPVALRARQERGRGGRQPGVDSNAVDVLPRAPPHRRRRRQQQHPARQAQRKISVVRRSRTPHDGRVRRTRSRCRPCPRAWSTARTALYVSQLTGFPFPVGGASVFRVNPRTGARRCTPAASPTSSTSTSGATGRSTCSRSTRLAAPAGRPEGGLWTVPPGGGTPERVRCRRARSSTRAASTSPRATLYVTNQGPSPGTGELLRIRLGTPASPPQVVRRRGEGCARARGAAVALTLG